MRDVTLVGVTRRRAARAGRRRAAMSRSRGGERGHSDWWIGADDRWRVPAREPCRAPGARRGHAGRRDRDARAERRRGPAGLRRRRAGRRPRDRRDRERLAGAFVVAFIDRGAPLGEWPTRVHIVVDGRTVLIVPGAPSRWTVRSGTTGQSSTIGRRTIRAVPGDRATAQGPLQAAFLYPLSHRNRLRVALVGRAATIPARSTSRPPRGARRGGAARGWHAQLDHGYARRPARPEALRHGRRARPVPGAARPRSPDAGDDRRARGLGSRRRAAEAWANLAGAMSLGGAAYRARATWAGRLRRADAGRAPLAVRRVARRTSATSTGIELAPTSRTEWRGQDFEVHDAPTRAGPLSYAVRWHGTRPALLWEVTDPRPPVLRARARPAWSTTDPTGDALLTEARHDGRDAEDGVRCRPSAAQLEAERRDAAQGPSASSPSNARLGRPSRSMRQPGARARRRARSSPTSARRQR